MDKWQCKNCSYMYDPEEGDLDNDIEAGIPFEDLPKKWTCPECGAQKNKFKPYEEEDEFENIEEEEE